MIDAGSKTARSITGLAIFIAAGCGMAMNAQFGFNLGSSQAEKIAFAAFGIAVDLAKVFALGFAAYAWSKRHHAKAAACIIVWLTTVAYASTAAIGFASTARDATVASRSGEAGDYKSAIADRDAFQSQMAAARKNPLFEQTFGCSRYDPNAAEGTPAGRRAEFCSTYWRTASQLDELKPKIATAHFTDADPQAALFARMTGLPRETVSLGLALFVAGVTEIISSLGTWTFSTSRQAPSRRRKRRVRRYRAQRRSRPRLVVAN